MFFEQNVNMVRVEEIELQFLFRVRLFILSTDFYQRKQDRTSYLMRRKYYSVTRESRIIWL